MNEEDWKQICKKGGTYYIHLSEVKYKFANIPTPIRLYCWYFYKHKPIRK